MQTLPCSGGITGLTFSPDGDLLAGLGPGWLYCWTRSRNWEPSGLAVPLVESAAFHPDGLSLAYSAMYVDGFGGPLAREVRFHPLTPACRTEPERLPIDRAGEPDSTAGTWLRQIAFTPEGRALVTNQLESRGLFYSPVSVVLSWHLVPAPGGWRASAPTRTVAPNGAALVEDRVLVLVGLWGTGVCPLDPSATDPLAAPDVSRARFAAAAPRGELIAVGEERRVRVWHLRTPAPRATWRLPEYRFAPVAVFAPDGRALAIGAEDGSVTFFDPLTGRAVAVFDFGVGSVLSLAYAPDGLTLAVAGRNGLVVVVVE